MPDELLTRSFNQFRRSEVRWLWPGRIPAAKLTLLMGDPGVGKSYITCDLAARVSRGSSGGGDWPDGPNPEAEGGDVLMLSAEDDPSDTLLPRLIAAGADTSRVHFVEGVAPSDGAPLSSLSLDRHIGSLAVRLRALPRPRLVVIDPISAYMGAVDSHRNADVRAVLAELATLAHQSGAAVLCVTHLSKSGSGGGGGGGAGGERGKTIYRAMGSLAFTAAARVVWHVAQHPANPAHRTMLMVKSNIGPRPGGLVFTIDGGNDSAAGGADGGERTLRWLQTDCGLTPDEVEVGEIGSAMDDAVEFLREELASGPRLAADLLVLAERVGHNDRTLRRAKRLLGVAASKDGTGGWSWMLATTPQRGGIEQGGQAVRTACPPCSPAVPGGEAVALPARLFPPAPPTTKGPAMPSKKKRRKPTSRRR